MTNLELSNSDSAYSICLVKFYENCLLFDNHHRYTTFINRFSNSLLFYTNRTNTHTHTHTHTRTHTTIEI